MDIKLTEKIIKETSPIGNCFTTDEFPGVVFLVIREAKECISCFDCLILSSDVNYWDVGDFRERFVYNDALIPWHGKIEIEV